MTCPICANTGVDMTRDGSADACGRCAKLAEAAWRAQREPATERKPRVLECAA